MERNILAYPYPHLIEFIYRNPRDLLPQIVFQKIAKKKGRLQRLYAEGINQKFTRHVACDIGAGSCHAAPEKRGAGNID